MEEDKKIKMLLQEYALGETSSTFNDDVMLKIKAAVLTQKTRPLLNTFILNLLKIIFCVVVVVIVGCTILFPINLPATFSININSNIYKQLFSFIIVFWAGMFMNLWWNKRWNSKNVFSI